MHIADRAERERLAYDEGLRRTRYNQIFRHTHYLYRQRRHDAVAELLRRVPHDRVLEIGSTAWTLFLEQNGIHPAELTCINISERELGSGIEAAQHSQLKPRFKIMDAHALEIPDGSCDVVFGVSVLHHLNLETALQEVRRVLKPTGLMIFAEPLDINPFGRMVRALTPEARTEDERPFRDHDLQMIDRYFECDLHFEQLLSVPLGIVAGMLFKHEDNQLTRAAFGLDEALQRWFPRLGPHYRHVLIVGRARPAVLPAS